MFLKYNLTDNGSFSDNLELIVGIVDSYYWILYEVVLLQLYTLESCTRLM